MKEYLVEVFGRSIWKKYLEQLFGRSIWKKFLEEVTAFKKYMF